MLLFFLLLTIRKSLNIRIVICAENLRRINEHRLLKFTSILSLNSTILLYGWTQLSVVFVFLIFSSIVFYIRESIKDHLHLLSIAIATCISKDFSLVLSYNMKMHENQNNTFLFYF